MKIRRRTEIFLMLLLAVGAAGTDDLAIGGKNGCSVVKRAWGLHGLGSHMVPNSPLPGL